jgi:ABC-type antimicrobial peptide transport system ATPase subunit
MIQVKELRKTFRSKDRNSKGATVEAVRSINFAVQKGEIALMPNRCPRRSAFVRRQNSERTTWPQAALGG